MISNERAFEKDGVSYTNVHCRACGKFIDSEFYEESDSGTCRQCAADDDEAWSRIIFERSERNKEDS